MLKKLVTYDECYQNHHDQIGKHLCCNPFEGWVGPHLREVVLQWMSFHSFLPSWVQEWVQSIQGAFGSFGPKQIMTKRPKQYLFKIFLLLFFKEIYYLGNVSFFKKISCLENFFLWYTIVFNSGLETLNILHQLEIGSFGLNFLNGSRN